MAALAVAAGCAPEASVSDAGMDAAIERDAWTADSRGAPHDAREEATRDAIPDAGTPDTFVVPDACPAPTTLCGLVCADLRADPDHCGGCDMPCIPRAGSIPFCGASRCVNAVCRPGFGNCDGMRDNGCEVTVDTSVEHCGLCGHACPAAPHAIAGCADSLCTLACEPGWVDCEPSIAGCECELPDAGL